MRSRQGRSRGKRSAHIQAAAMSDDLQTVLCDGMDKGFTEIGFQRCLELMARMEHDGHREAWFDIFYDCWSTRWIVPNALRPSYKAVLYQRILTIRRLLARPKSRCRSSRHICTLCHGVRFE